MLQLQPNTQWSLVQKRTHLGDHFAFFSENCLEGSQLNWVTHLVGSLSHPRRVVPLWSLTAVELPGATHFGADRLAVGTAVVTADKDLYQTMTDRVHLALVDPYHPGRRAQLKLKLEGNDYQTYPVLFDEHGAGEVIVTHLPSGNYAAELVTETETGPACRFRVAEYRLVPLVARLAESHSHDCTFHFRLELESFGIPTQGEVKVTLMEEERVRTQQTLHCQDGQLSGEVQLVGEGPFSLNLQLAADPSRTATVPLTGSRAREREKTLLSSLGRTVEASMLPSRNALEVRGLYLEEGAQRNTPLKLERVDTRRVRLVAGGDLKGLVVALSDPTFPGLATPASPLPHPEQTDNEYRKGFHLYKQAQYAEAHSVFAAIWRKAALKGQAIHPYYAYNAACCQALAGNPAEALTWLENSLRDGLKDWPMLARDDDFASLRQHPRFQHLLRGGLIVREVGDLAAGESVEVDLEGNLALLVAGAFVDGSPWEGRALVMAPVALSPALQATFQEELVVELEGPAEGCAYVLVKDARLLSQDHPASRLAERLKEGARRWQASRCREENPPTLASLRESEEEKQLWNTSPSSDPFSSAWTNVPAHHPFATARLNRPTPSPGGPSPVVPGGSYDLFGSSSDPFDSPGDPFGGPAASDPFASGDLFASGDPFCACDPFAAPAADPFASGGAEAESPMPRAALMEVESEPARPEPAPAHPPQTLFAGWLPLQDGRLALRLPVGEQPQTLQVEALVLSQRDWKRLETRCQVAADPCIDLQVTPYVQPGDRVWGRLQARSDTRSLKVSLTRDGQDCPLEPTAPQCWRFELRPGHYVCEVLDQDSALSWRREARVQAPGKFTSLSRAPHLLQAGETLSRLNDPSILGFRLLPTLDQPFKLCLNATVDYEHCCCEQTAAKLVAGCALWVFGDDRERARAESIIRAGIKRLETMWLRGQGFRTYPESTAVRDTHWGPKAARYLWVLNSLQAAPQLAAEVAAGIRMAEDASWAYGMTWPPQAIRSHQDAYWALRYQPQNQEARAFLSRQAEGASVAGRVEKAYQAAALVLSGQDLKRALELANQVTSAFNQDGRLYSTADSVAAIALLMTLKQRGLGQSPAQADLSEDEVKVHDGVCIVEVTRLVETGWAGLATRVPLSVSLEGVAGTTWRCQPGDSLDLVVKLEEGYVSGDLLWICLPESLSRVVGGGQIKLFSVDFQGKPEVRVPLAVTSKRRLPKLQRLPAQHVRRRASWQPRPPDGAGRLLNPRRTPTPCCGRLTTSCPD